MKITMLNKIKPFLAVLLVLLLCNTARGQFITYPLAAEAITRGLDNTILTVRIDFPVCADKSVRVDLGALPNSGIIEYIPNSVTKIGGTATINITEQDVSNKQSPIFNIGATQTGEFIIFTLRRRANCGTASATKDNIFVTSANCTFSETDPSVNAYNLLSPALTLIPPAQLNNVTIGTPYSRSFTVTNGGNGCLDTLFVWLKYPAGEVQFNNLVLAGQTITPTFITADSIFFKITGVNLPSGSFCNGQTLTFTENITFLKCNTVTTYYVGWNSWYNELCETDRAQSFVTMSTNLPNVAASIINPNYNFCFNSTRLKQTVRLTNTGAGPASNISLSLSNTLSGSFIGFNDWDTTVNYVIKNNLGDSIGLLKNFTNVVTRWVPYTNCNIWERAVESAVGHTTPGVIIPAGSFIDIEVWTKQYNLSCQQNWCYDAVGWLGLVTKVYYSNQCNTATFADAERALMFRSYFYSLFQAEGPSTILPGAFNIQISFSELRTMNNPDGSGATYLNFPLPPGISLGATTVTIAGNNLPFTTTSPITNNVTDTAWIGPIPQNVFYTNPFSTNIPLVATCGAGGLKTFDFSVLNKYGACAPWQKFTCRRFVTTLLCPSPCDKGGATPVAFDLVRTNYGQPDNNDDHIADAAGAINTEKIALHRCVNGDTLKGIWNIKIRPNQEPTDPNYGQNFKYVYVDFDLGDAYPALTSLIALPNATVKVYNTAGVLINTCTVNPTIIGKKAHYEFAASCRQSGAVQWENNDSLVIEASYKVYAYNGSNNQNNYPGFDMYFTKNEVYSTYTQKTTPQTAPVNGETYTCMHFESYAQICRIWLSDWIYGGQNLNGCGGDVLAYVRQYLRNQEPATIFPFEYRNFGIPDSIHVVIPPEFTFRPNSARFNQTETWGQVTVPNSNVVQNGNIVSVYVKNLFSGYGGNIVPWDEVYNDILSFKVDPTCSALPGNYPSNVLTVNSGNDVNTPANNWWMHDNYGGVKKGTSQQLGYTYTAPMPIITGGGSVSSTNGNGSWSFQVQNLSNDIQANDTYLYLTNATNFSNFILQEGNITINPDANGFYRINNLAQSANRSFVLTAKINGACTVDSLRVNVGFSCTGYPTTFTAGTCTSGSWFKIQNQPSQIQLSVERQPKAPSVDFCSNDTLIFKINSAQAAFADNPTFKVTPPTGFVINTGQIEYPLNSNNWVTITPTITGGVYFYKIEDHPTITSLWGTQGLPGTVDFAGAEQRGAQLRLIYSVSCGFTSGSKLLIQQIADRPCGAPIPNNLGYNNAVRSEPIRVTGTTVSGTADLDVVTMPANTPCGITAFNNTATPILSTTQPGDTIVITIPNGLTYYGNFSSNSGVVIAAGFPTAGAGGTQIIKLVVPIGIMPGTPLNYSFSVVPSNINNGCASYDVTQDYVRNTPPLSCGATVCTTNSSTILGSVQKIITVTKPDLRITHVQLLSGAGSYRPGGTIVAGVTVSNTGNLNAAAPFNIDFYCASSAQPFTTLPFNSNIVAGQSLTQNFTITIANAPTCNSGDVLRAALRPFNNCTCDSTSRGFFNVLPLQLINFTAQKTTNGTVIKWQIANDNVATKYILQQSTNGSTFIDVTQIAYNQSGNYNYLHNLSGQLNTTNYYRLKIIDAAGSEQFSKTIKLANLIDGEIFATAQPIPFTNYLQVYIESYTSQKAQLSIINGIGSILFTTTATLQKGNNKVLLNQLANLPSANYWLKITTSLGQVKTIRVIK
jgi:hypothetical protein